jgi:hypothetical protein
VSGAIAAIDCCISNNLYYLAEVDHENRWEPKVA